LHAVQTVILLQWSQLFVSLCCCTATANYWSGSWIQKTSVCQMTELNSPKRACAARLEFYCE